MLTAFFLLLLCEFSYANNRVLQTVLHKYDNESPPNTEPLVITLGLDLIHIIDADVDKNELEMVVYLSESWMDTRLQWIPDPRDGFPNNVHINANRLWMPDIVGYNQVEASDIISPKITQVADTGEVYYVPSMKTRFVCNLETLDSEQGTNCTLSLGSWTYNGNQLDLAFLGAPSLNDYTGDSRYEILGTHAERNVVHYPCCPEPYVKIHFIITLRKFKHSYFSSWLQ